MQNKNMRELFAERMARDVMKKARADIHVQVSGGAALAECSGDEVGVLIAVSAICTGYIKGCMSQGDSLEKCKEGLMVAINQAVKDAASGR